LLYGIEKLFFTLIFIWTSEKNKALGGVLWNKP